MHSVVSAAVRPAIPRAARLIDVPDGAAGTRAVLRLMRTEVRKAKVDPVIRAWAVAITQHVANKDYRGEAAALQGWTRSNVRYVRDVRGVETLQAPGYLLRSIGEGLPAAGDCDDQSMLVASLLESINHPTRFVAIGRTPGGYSHVYVETLVADRWLAVETTAPLAFGEAPQLPYKIVVHN